MGLEPSEFAEVGGITVTADEIAEKLITFWRARLKVPPPWPLDPVSAAPQTK
jgi:hypothetical protein